MAAKHLIMQSRRVDIGCSQIMADAGQLW